MNDESPEPVTARKRVRTATVSYPYHHLALCLDVAKAVREIGNGKSEVSRSLLASHLGVDEKSADFSQKIASTKCYGLMEGRSAFTLSDIAIGLYFPTEDPERQRRLALLEAVRQPGAFAALLNRYDGSKPPLKNFLETCSAEKWASRKAGSSGLLRSS